MRLSIARSLGIALTALTVVLAVVAGIGVSRLYKARQHYETTLAQTSTVHDRGRKSDQRRDLRGRGAARRERARRARGPCGRQARP